MGAVPTWTSTARSLDCPSNFAEPNHPIFLIRPGVLWSTCEFASGTSLNSVPIPSISLPVFRRATGRTVMRHRTTFRGIDPCPRSATTSKPCDSSFALNQRIYLPRFPTETAKPSCEKRCSWQTTTPTISVSWYSFAGHFAMARGLSEWVVRIAPVVATGADRLSLIRNEPVWVSRKRTGRYQRAGMMKSANLHGSYHGHSRAGGNGGSFPAGDWIPACEGTTRQ